MLVRELANWLNAAWEGDGELDLTGVAPIEDAGPHDLSFVARRNKSPSTRAGCLLVPPDFPDQSVRALIRTQDPRGSMARAISTLLPPPSWTPGIHPTAVIDLTAVISAEAWIGPLVTIGARTRIGPGTRLSAGVTIGNDVVIGDGCLLHPRVTLYDHVSLGNEVILHSGCVLGADGFGFVLTAGAYEKFPQVGRVEIGDRVEIGANSCVDRAALGVTTIGAGTKLDNMVHIGHNCRIGKHVVIAAQTGFSGGVIVEDYAIIGGQVGVGDKVRIESRAVLGSGSGVLTSKIVRAGQVMWGTPARPLKEYLEQLAVLSRIAKKRKGDR